MKLTQSTLQKFFTVKYKGRIYYIDYLNSDDQILVGNRDYWEVLDEDLGELNIYIFKDTTKKEKEQIKKNAELRNKLINFCIKHFNDYQPNYKEDF